MKIRSLLAAGAIAASALVGPALTGTAAADTCSGATKIGGQDLAAGQQLPETRTSYTTIAVGQHPNVIYVQVREVMTDEYTWSVWLYAESNNRIGLQRGGTSPASLPSAVPVVGGPNSDTACTDAGTPDTLIY